MDDHYVPRRKWGMQPILDYYVFREFMIVFSICIMAFAMLFLIGDLINDLQDFLSNNVKFDTIAYFFSLRLVVNIRFIFPISLLLSCIYIMATMGKNNEITAMRASGISLPRCAGAIYLVALLVTGLNFWFNETLAPFCDAESFVIKKSASNPNFRDDVNSMIPYRSPDGTRSWLFGGFSSKGTQRNVKIKKYDLNGALEWDMTAETADYRPDEGWVFRRVTLTQFDKDSKMPRATQKLDLVRKSSEDFPETPSTIITDVKPAAELSSAQIIDLLRRTKDMSRTCRNIYESTLYNNLAFPWICLLSVFLGVPLAGGNARRGIMISVVSAVAVVVAFTCASQIFLVLGKRGMMPPLVAGFAPILTLAAYVVYSMRRSG